MTVLELLLDYLPEKYVDAIANNIKNKDALRQKATTFSSDLLTLFDWEESKEGYEFWDSLLDAVLSNQDLPMLPITINYLPSTTFVCRKHIYVMNAADTNINVAFDFDLSKIKEMDPYKKEKVFAFLN